MKHSEKIFFVLSLAVLGASIFYYAKSMEQLSVEEGKNQARLQEKAKGVEWKNITVPELKIVDLEWPEIRPQDEEGKWFFQVFTPPQIWVDKDGNFITESPYQKEVARQRFAYSFGGVSNEPYYISFSGYTGTVKNPTVMLRDERSGKVLHGKLNEEIIIPATNFTKEKNTGITVKTFDVKRVRKPSGMIEQEVTIKLYDKSLKKEVEVYSFKPTYIGDQRRMTLKANDGTDWIIKKVGETTTKGDAKYEVTALDLDKEFALIKMIPQTDKGETRVMRVSASGVEQK